MTNSDDDRRSDGEETQQDTPDSDKIGPLTRRQILGVTATAAGAAGVGYFSWRRFSHRGPLRSGIGELTGEPGSPGQDAFNPLKE